MEILILFMIFPVAAGLFARYYLKHTYTWQEFACSLAISLVLMCAVYFTGLYSEMVDTEILNGEIVSKTRDHGTYMESYSCRCRTVTRGTGNNRYTTTTCDTCYRKHYTVKWFADSTVGRIDFGSKDSLSSSVYASPDPQSYTDCYVGEPASQPNTYLNYVKAVPESLFNTALANQSYSDLVPEYPRIHSLYRVNRVIDVNSGLSSDILKELDNQLDTHLKMLGPAKQANIIAIFTNILDPAYRHAVENSWVGGKKNDIVLFFGVDGEKIVWTDVMTWALNSGNEFLVAQLKQKLADIKTVDVTQISTLTRNMVDGLYVRPKMEDYEYLKSDIRPSETVIAVCWVISILGTLVLTWFFHAKVDIGNNKRYTKFRKFR